MADVAAVRRLSETGQAHGRIVARRESRTRVCGSTCRLYTSTVPSSSSSPSSPSTLLPENSYFPVSSSAVACKPMVPLR